MNEILHGRNAAEKLTQLGPALWQFSAAAGGFALAAGGVFGGLHPLGIGMVLGISQPFLFSGAAGAALGYLLLPMHLGLRYLAAVAAALAGRCLFPKTWPPGTVGGCGVLLGVQLMLALSGLSTPLQSIAALGDALLAAGFGRLLRWSAGQRSLWIGPLPAQGILMGLASLPAFCGVPAGPVQAGTVLLGAAGLVLAYRGRVRECGAVCVAGATLMAASRPELCFAGLGISAACLTAAWTTPGERTGSGAVFLAVCVFGSLAAGDSLAALGFLGSAVLAELTFFALPRRWLAALPGQADGTLTSSSRPQIAGAASRLEQVAQALIGIAETVDRVYEALPRRGETYNWVVERMANELCRSCARREQCWVQEYDNTVDGFFALKPVLEQSGRVEIEQLPGQFCRCIHPTELSSCAGRAYTLYKSRREGRVRAGAMREAVTEQYTAMAQALSHMAAQLGQAVAPDEGKTAHISSLFASIGLEPLEVQVGYEATGRLRALVTVSRTSFSETELEELRQEVQRICHRPIRAFQVDHSGVVSVITICEQAVFCPVFGVASHSAREGACGDAVEQFCDTYGNAHLMLCDGMGTGRPAAIDGTMAARLCAQLLRAGFTAESAARLVNVALALKSEEESAATLDLVTADLFTGRSTLFKAGACPTFLVRQGQVRQLEGSSLPVGIMSRVTGRQDTVTLSEGQMAVLVSDGVLCDGSGWICQQLELCASVGSSPQEVAGILADTALERAKSRGRPDDITVAVMRLDRVG